MRRIVIALGLGGRRDGNAAIGRIHHQRSLARADNFGARVEPDLVVGADVAGFGRTIHAIRGGAFLELRGFLGRQDGFVGKFLRALEGRDGGVGPDALEVGLPVGGVRWGPLLRLGFGALGRCGSD